MTQKPPRPPRAALLIGAALLATPAFAQDSQTVTPPPVVATIPQASPAPAPAPSVSFAPAAPVVQAVPDVPKAQTPPRYAAQNAARRTATTTATTRQVTRAAAPAPASAPAAAPATQPAPQAATPVEQPAPAVVAPADTTPVTAAQDTSTTANTATDAAPRQNAIWPWLLGGALIVAGVIAALLFRRRREYDEVYEETYEPAYAADAVAPEQAYISEPAVAPIAASAPVVMDETAPAAIAEDAELHQAAAEDLADLTAAAPVSHRPWLEFGMRPVRAGTSSDEALVELELTVANSGDEPARDVRISTFLLKDGDAGEMERMLTGRDDTTVPPVTIPAGEGTRVDATLAMRREDVAQGDSFSPVVVADARYTLPDGSEGRTAATFRVGLWNGEDGIEPIALGRPQMHDNVAAELTGTPEHA